ncbi:hypothetical protein HPB50_027671 [Hyalomma asiaticum]|nr:hypothetical protein HPB50_027671 [Hyalomma asiaticum]
MTAKHYVRKITKASRMPNLRTDDFKIVVRPRNGFNVSNYQKDRIHCCIRNAAGVGRDTAEEDSVCINERQNVTVVSTPSEDRARRYGGICKLRIADREFEASAYRAAPENTSKGHIRGISLDEGRADVVKSLEYQRNPTVLDDNGNAEYAKRRTLLTAAASPATTQKTGPSDDAHHQDETVATA